MSIQYEPAARLAAQFIEHRLASRIWARDVAAWGAGPDSPNARSIATRLGWLDASASMTPHLDRVIALATSARRDGIHAVYLLGMGGSSLCAEVVRAVCGVAETHPDLFVLDTTDESAIASAAGRLDPARSLFLVSSKSGGTVEVASLERFFWSRMTAALGAGAGRHFVAITDPGTALETLATSRGYREVFLNPADIGGRFSALSLFGLVPAALIGAPVGDLVAAGAAMAEGCRQDNHSNAGLELGAFIGAAAREGRDKLTVALPPSLATLGLWIEQLIAESTGKQGKGLLPVVDEPIGRPDEYGSDRAFVSVATDVDSPDPERLEALAAAGYPVLRLSTRLESLGAEFFRWEFATSVAGAALGLNPFDEPNVAEAKDKTRALLRSFASAGRLPEPEPAAADTSVAVYSNSFASSGPGGIVRQAVGSIGAGDYAAFLSYLPATSDIGAAVADIRSGLRSRTKAASTFGVGPRYLHSTGQYHKGGPNTAIAFVLTADDDTSTEIPESGYSFAILKRAQALGDVDTLQAHGRRTVRLHFTDRARAPQTIERLFAEALK